MKLQLLQIFILSASVNIASAQSLEEYKKNEKILYSADQLIAKTDLFIEYQRNEYAKKLANDTNQNYPIYLDEDTTIKEVYSVGSNVVTVYETYMKNKTVDEMKKYLLMFKNFEKSGKIKVMCNSVLKDIVNLGITYTFVNTIRNGDVVYDYTIGKSDCF
jgi:hypothetical protein